MELIELIRQFARKQARLVSHYPRGHLTLAGTLCGIVLVLLVLPLGGGEDEAKSRTEIVLDIDLSPDLERSVEPRQDQTDELAMSDFIITPEIKDQPKLEDVTLWQNIEIKSGDKVSAIFSKVGLSDQDLFRVLNSSDEAKVLNQVYPGYQLDFLIPVNADGKGELEQLRLLKSPLEGFLFTRNNNNYDVESILNFPQLRPTFKVGTIADSLFMAGQREQIPAVTIMEMANIFGGVIDFILDPRTGDDFSILYDEKYLDGEFIGHGDILATQYTNQGKTFTAVRYSNDEGEVGYYNAEGESMRKAFLRSPLDVFRISSNFNPNRRHPILNTIRAHKGTDYAAPRGTPIRATSDGQVTRASRNGSFGNLVIVKHAGGFETKYAHLSKYANGIKKGKRVRQGDIIGYVGTTGSATGPHLHYEFLMGGVHQNPRTIIDKLPKAESINPAEMDSFRTQTADLLKRFSNMNSTTFITLNQPSAD
ncbi:MAG: peptidoglycan DD-metalloendopeptidase family protein [Gammaproteobacteria bacterium]|nr:peptidoglycan DD-metalloendopeptidase family protein [Gammaproteobacteria bacterium]